MTVVALHEKLASIVLLAVLLATLVATRHQQVESVYQELIVMPRPPAEAQLRSIFPLDPLTLETLQHTADIATYTPLIAQDPFVRVKTAAPGDTGAAPAEAKAPVPSELVFRGRVALAGRQMAVVEVVDSHETFFVGVGQSVDGWKVIDIDGERVVLSKPPDQQLTLRLADNATRQGH